MKLIFSLIGLILFLYVVAVLALFLLQRTFIYYPTPVVEHRFVDKIVDVGNGVEVNLVVGNEGMTDAVVYFGGNAESVASTARDLVAALTDKTVYLVNYRGYGGSEGQPTEKNLIKDAEKIFDSISENHSRISVIGRSLGSGVACRIAVQRPVEKMVLITPYDSILNIASATYPMFPVRWLLKDQYRSIDYVNSIKIPILAIIAEHDFVIPAANSNRLIGSFTNDPEVIVLPNTGHNDLQSDPVYYRSIKEFLN